MAGWTDYIPDWSSKDKLRLYSVYDALSALTTAVNERGSVLNSYTPLPMVNRLYPVKYYVDLIDAKVKNIVPQFVNHTMNDGDFTGLDAIPMWTNGAVREYGLRPDGTQKEMGFLGEIICAEDPETVFTEISVGVNINGTEMDVPTLVPTLTDAELFYMITEGYKVAPSEWSDTIIEKASLHAQSRIASNLSPFASDGEQTYRAGFNYRHSRLMSILDWVYRQYQIINKLRWSLAHISGVYHDYGQLRHSQIFGGGNYLYSDSNTTGNRGNFEDFTYTSDYAVLAPYSDIAWGIATPYTSGNLIRGTKSLMGSAGEPSVIAMGKDSLKANKAKINIDYKTSKVSAILGGTYYRHLSRYKLVGGVWMSVTELDINESISTIHTRDITKNEDNTFFVSIDESLDMLEPPDYPFSDDTSRICNNSDIELWNYSILYFLNEFDGTDGFTFKDW